MDINHHIILLDTTDHCSSGELLLTKGPGLSDDEYIVYICIGIRKSSPPVVYPWIPLCGDQWSNKEATVICRQQGQDVEGGMINVPIFTCNNLFP